MTPSSTQVNGKEQALLYSDAVGKKTRQSSDSTGLHTKVVTTTTDKSLDTNKFAPLSDSGSPKVKDSSQKISNTIEISNKQEPTPAEASLVKNCVQRDVKKEKHNSQELVQRLIDEISRLSKKEFEHDKKGHAERTIASVNKEKEALNNELRRLQKKIEHNDLFSESSIPDIAKSKHQTGAQIKQQLDQLTDAHEKRKKSYDDLNSDLMRLEYLEKSILVYIEDLKIDNDIYSKHRDFNKKLGEWKKAVASENDFSKLEESHKRLLNAFNSLKEPTKNELTCLKQKFEVQSETTYKFYNDNIQKSSDAEHKKELEAIRQHQLSQHDDLAEAYQICILEMQDATEQLLSKDIELNLLNYLQTWISKRQEWDLSFAKWQEAFVDADKEKLSLLKKNHSNRNKKDIEDHRDNLEKLKQIADTKVGKINEVIENNKNIPVEVELLDQERNGRLVNLMQAKDLAIGTDRLALKEKIESNMATLFISFHKAHFDFLNVEDKLLVMEFKLDTFKQLEDVRNLCGALLTKLETAMKEVREYLEKSLGIPKDKTNACEEEYKSLGSRATILLDKGIKAILPILDRKPSESFEKLSANLTFLNPKIQGDIQGYFTKLHEEIFKEAEKIKSDFKRTEEAVVKYFDETLLSKINRTKDGIETKVIPYDWTYKHLYSKQPYHLESSIKRTVKN